MSCDLLRGAAREEEGTSGVGNKMKGCSGVVKSV